MSKKSNPANLTPKREKFCLEFIKTGNQSEAYRRSFDAEKMNDESVRVEASRLMDDPNVTLRISTLQKKAEDKAVLSNTWVLERLMRNAKIALGEETVKLKLRRGEDIEEVELSMRDAGAANKALELLGKYRDMRMWVEQVESGDPNDFSKYSDDELKAKILEEAVELGIAPAPARNGSGKPN